MSEKFFKISCKFKLFLSRKNKQNVFFKFMEVIGCRQNGKSNYLKDVYFGHVQVTNHSLNQHSGKLGQNKVGYHLILKNRISRKKLMILHQNVWFTEKVNVKSFEIKAKQEMMQE